MAIYAKITGSKTGAFTGDVKEVPFVGQIHTLSSNFGLSRPMDAQTMTPTGRAVIHPLTITKRLDKTSPLFVQAAYHNESLTVILSHSFDGSSATAKKTVASVKLSQAMIQDLRHAAGPDGNAVETITFGFVELEITWIDGGVTAVIAVNK